MAEPIAIDRLAEALGLGNHELVSLVGGGGKTTMLFELGRQLEGTVVLTTTTKMQRSRTAGRPVLCAPLDGELADALAEHRVVLVWQSDAGEKAHGVDPDACGRWFGLADHVIVEADGSRGRPFKVPGPLEPVVPTLTTMLVGCVGAAAIGRVIADQCHRPMRVAAVAGCSPYQCLTPERLATVVSSERGLLKARPAGARAAIVVTNVGEGERALVDELRSWVDGRVPIIAIAPIAPTTDTLG